MHSTGNARSFDCCAFSQRLVMSDPSNPRRPKRNSYRPRPETLALLKSSGNSINGLGEAAPRRPSPFFWHPADQHPFGELQMVARQSSRKCPGSASAFHAAYDYPELLPVAELQNESPAEQLAAAATSFAVSHKADAVGVARHGSALCVRGIPDRRTMGHRARVGAQLRAPERSALRRNQQIWSRKKELLFVCAK